MDGSSAPNKKNRRKRRRRRAVVQREVRRERSRRRTRRRVSISSSPVPVPVSTSPVPYRKKSGEVEKAEKRVGLVGRAVFLGAGAAAAKAVAVLVSGLGYPTLGKVVPLGFGAVLAKGMVLKGKTRVYGRLVGYGMIAFAAGSLLSPVFDWVVNKIRGLGSK